LDEVNTAFVGHTGRWAREIATANFREHPF
jgi:hypothetical protein